MLCPFCGKEITEASPGDEQRQYEARRTFRARKDARVGTITRAIEDVFDLPKGAVIIRTPEQKPFRSDALIDTVRNRWN